MSTDINLFVLGLCIVDETDRNPGNYTVIAVGPPAGSSIPEHLVYLGIQAESVEVDPGLPALDKESTYPSTMIPTGMRFMQLDPQTTFGFQEPNSAAGPATLDSHIPASVEELGLDSLRPGVGQGNWTDGELGRMLLPRSNAVAGWAKWLGNYLIPHTGIERDVADLFYWRASYDEVCTIEYRRNGTVIGEVELSGQAEIRLVCYSPEEEETDALPFDYSSAFSQLCTVQNHQKPILLSETPGSGSCPPVRNP